MKINKQTPRDDVKQQLLQTLNTPKNKKYAKKLDNLDDGQYGKTILRGVISAAAVLVVAVAVAIFALVGREIWHKDNLVPATPPDFYNHIFIHGKYMGIIKDGEFSPTDRYFNDLLSKECLYDVNGKKIKEIYINVSTLNVLMPGETVSYASRLEKFASGKYKNYLKFTLPVEMDDEIPMMLNSVAFSQDEIDNGPRPEHKYVTAYKIKFKSLSKYETSLTDEDCEAIKSITEIVVNKDQPAYAFDIDNDGVIEKITTVTSDGTNSDYEYHYVVVVDSNSYPDTCGAYIVRGDREAMKGEAVNKYELFDIVDFNLDGKYKIIVDYKLFSPSSSTLETRHELMVFRAKDGIADWLTTVYIKLKQEGIIVREFATRVANMAFGTDFDMWEYDCEWYKKLCQTDYINLEGSMTLNEIYFGIEGFAKLYNIELVGWDKESVWEPYAEIYDPTNTVLREKAEELMKVAESAFKKSKFKINIDKEQAASITITDPNAPNDKTITDKGEIERIVEFLNKTPIKSAKYSPGLPTSGAPSLSVKDSEGNIVFGCMLEADKFYIRGCEYTLESDYYTDLIQ